MKAIIFDFDGVLFDSERIHLQACNQVFKKLGFQVPEEIYFKHYVGMSDIELFPQILSFYKSNQIFSISDLISQKLNAYQNFVAQAEYLLGVPGVHEFIKTCAKKINTLAICSGAMRAEIDVTLHKLERGELKKYFSCITTIDDIQEGKPSPEGYLLTAQRLSVLPEDCIVIEDTPKGIDAAKNAHMRVIALTTSMDRSKLQRADFIADSYDEITTWLKINSVKI